MPDFRQFFVLCFYDISGKCIMPFMKTKKNVLTLIKKIEALPAEKINEVEDFVEFLANKGSERLLTRAASKLSEKSFAKTWNNPEDAIYDKL